MERTQHAVARAWRIWASDRLLDPVGAVGRCCHSDHGVRGKWEGDRQGTSALMVVLDPVEGSGSLPSQLPQLLPVAYSHLRTVQVFFCASETHAMLALS